MQFIMMLSAERDRKIITVFYAQSPAVANDPEMMSVGCGVPTNATAALADGLQMLLAAEALRRLRM